MYFKFLKLFLTFPGFFFGIFETTIRLWELEFPYLNQGNRVYFWLRTFIQWQQNPYFFDNPRGILPIFLRKTWNFHLYYLFCYLPQGWGRHIKQKLPFNFVLELSFSSLHRMGFSPSSSGIKGLEYAFTNSSLSTGGGIYFLIIFSVVTFELASSFGWCYKLTSSFLI